MIRPARKLHWFQYSLRSLFLLVFLVSLGMSWVAVKMKTAREQKEAVEEIKKLGGYVQYDYESEQLRKRLPIAGPPGPVWLRNLLGEDFFATVVGVMFTSTSATDAGLAHLTGLTQLEWLTLGGTKVTDAGLEHLRALTQLQELALEDTKITDAGLEHLKGMTQLQTLYPNGTKVEDAGLEHLKGMTQLQTLYLNDTNANDAGVVRLEGLTQLKILGLRSTRVTDAGLEHFRGLRQLRFLNLDRTKVTNEGVNRLQRALPKCSIDRHPPTGVPARPSGVSYGGWSGAASPTLHSEPRRGVTR